MLHEILIFCLNFDDYGLLLMKILRASPKIKVSKKDLQYKNAQLLILNFGLHYHKLLHQCSVTWKLVALMKHY